MLPGETFRWNISTQEGSEMDIGWVCFFGALIICGIAMALLAAGLTEGW